MSELHSIPVLAGTNHLSRVLNLGQPRLRKALEESEVVADAVLVFGDKRLPVYNLARIEELAAIVATRPELEVLA